MNMHYPYEEGILKSYALILISQHPLPEKGINITDPVGLQMEVIYSDRREELIDDVYTPAKKTGRILYARLYHLNGHLDARQWKPLVLSN